MKRELLFGTVSGENCSSGYTGPALPDEDTENKIYRFTRKFLQEQGFERYEISNYAKPGKACRHNIGYWTEVAYLGIGLGASSYMEGCRLPMKEIWISIWL